MAAPAVRDTGYKTLGFAVWHGGRWYVRRRYGSFPFKAAAGATVAVAVVVTVAAGSRRSA